MSHLPGLFISPTQMSTAISTAVSGIPLGELPTQVHLDIAAAVQALPAGSTPAQVQAAITTALAGQPVGELPAQVHADIAAAVAALPVGATPAQVTAAITSATSGLATQAQLNALRVAPVPSTAPPVPATAFSDVTGTSYTMTQLAALVSAILTGGGTYTGTLALAQPTLSRIYQRDTRTGGAFGKGAGVVGLSVTLSVAVVTMDYRLRDADAAGNPVRQDWTALAGAEPAGTVALSPSVPASASRYLMDVRANGDTLHAVLGTQPFGVGEVVAVAGQSLALGMLMAGTNPEGSVVSAGVTPPANGYVFAPSTLPEQGEQVPAGWATVADGTGYDSAFAAEFLRLVTAQAGVAAALVGYAAGNTAIAAWQPGQADYATLRSVLDQVGRFGTLIWMQGHTDINGGTSTSAYTNLLTTLINDLAAHYAGPGGTLGSFARLIGSIPALNTSYWGTPDRVNAIRAGSMAHAASDPRARYVAALDATIGSDGTHPTQAGRVPMARDFYRAFMALAGLAPDKPGPSITGASRAAGSAVVKLAVAQGAGGTALAAVGTPTNQFAVYPAGTLTGALAISSLSIASLTEIDLTLAAVPADGQALDVWYRLADADTSAVTGSGIFDNATDGDGLTAGRQLQLVTAAIPAAAPNPQAAPAPPATAGATLTFTGPAGTPPAGLGLTSFAGQDATTAALDGQGGLIGPTVQANGGYFAGLGIVADRTIDVAYSTHSATDTLGLAFRVNPATDEHYICVVSGGYVSVQRHRSGAKTEVGTQFNFPAHTQSFGVRAAGDTFTLRADGADTSFVFTDTSSAPITANGYVGLYNWNGTAPTIAAVTASAAA